MSDKKPTNEPQPAGQTVTAPAQQQVKVAEAPKSQQAKAPAKKADMTPVPKGPKRPDTQPWPTEVIHTIRFAGTLPPIVINVNVSDPTAVTLEDVHRAMTPVLTGLLDIREMVSRPFTTESVGQPGEGQPHAGPDTSMAPHPPAPSAPVIPAEVADYPWQDAGKHPLMPDLGGLRLGTVELPTVGKLTLLDIKGMEISKHVAYIGAEVSRKKGQGRSCVYVAYQQKNGTRVSDFYRYATFDDVAWHDIVTLTRQMTQGLPTKLTVGEYVERVIKAKHEAGQAKCQRLTLGEWVNVETRDEKQAKTPQVTVAPEPPLPPLPRPTLVPAAPAPVEEETDPTDRVLDDLGLGDDALGLGDGATLGDLLGDESEGEGQGEDTLAGAFEDADEDEARF